jgi:hypothetical protein
MRERGLTLLELTIVVFILSALALSTVSLVDQTDHRYRHEDTQGRLLQLRRAIVGEPGAATLGGFVVDLGVLPDDVASLVHAPAGAESFGLKQPEFNASITLAAGLPKGWRGPYVALPPGGDPANARFRDGWGNVSRGASGDPDATLDAGHHGWNDLDPSATPFTVTSHGADGAAGDAGQTDFDADISIAISRNDWQVDLSSWSVDVLNASASDATVFVSVLVYENGTWTRLDSTATAIPAGTTESCTFPADTQAPIGRHLLVVVDDSDKEPFGHPSSQFTRQVSFPPRGLPQVRLVVR